MQRINTPDGNWYPGDPSQGIKGTVVTRHFMQTVQEELAAVPESVGMKLDPNDNKQLLKGIRKIYTDSIAGGIQTGGRVNGVNSPNLLFNGSAEFGSASWFSGNSSNIDTNGLVLKPAIGSYGEGTFWALDRDLDGKVVYFVDYSDFVGLGDGVTISLQAELFAGGLTGGSFYIDAEFYDDASPPKILGQSLQLKAPPDAGWTYLSASSAVPRGTRKLRIRKVLDGNPKGTRGLIACRRIKLEGGSASSLYSTEVDFQRVALLDSPALTGAPTAPTPDAKDNSTRLATTAFVQALSGTYATQQWVQGFAVKSGDGVPYMLTTNNERNAAWLSINGQNHGKLWTDMSFDPDSKLNTSGGTVGGRLALSKQGWQADFQLRNWREGQDVSTYFRARDGGGLEIINNAYNFVTWSVDDYGTMFMRGQQMLNTDGNLWCAYRGSWMSGILDDLYNRDNGKANAGATCQPYDFAEFGPLRQSTGTTTVDAPDTWFVKGIRTDNWNGDAAPRTLFLRCTRIRNT
ncbi:hypothetical protein [Burkholderia sp. MSMB1498]|uniref:hypothetical protein n=1 Tax=Burkholderia sp. MSMB1498 TaxID=1637842 RepID=UPI0009EC3B15|nr:hypothetical protein [Burkholderia sp. MSMB1498]